MNKKTVALTNEQFTEIVQTIAAGYPKHRANPKMAAVLIMQRNLGVRISDLTETYHTDADGTRHTVNGFSLSNIVKDGKIYRLQMTEKKTGKSRTFRIPDEVYSYIQSYYLQYQMKPTEPMFSITERAVQKAMKEVIEYLNQSKAEDEQYNSIGSHSIRKLAATEIYKASGNDINMTSQFLQHSSPAITQRYLRLNEEELNATIQKCVYLPEV